ncbi:MAG: hypothetical protein K6A44_05185 [bacterium]|nr:hypothetical protein [bacterium]
MLKNIIGQKNICGTLLGTISSILISVPLCNYVQESLYIHDAGLLYNIFFFVSVILHFSLAFIMVFLLPFIARKIKFQASLSVLLYILLLIFSVSLLSFNNTYGMALAVNLGIGLNINIYSGCFVLIFVVFYVLEIASIFVISKMLITSKQTKWQWVMVIAGILTTGANLILQLHKY